MYKNQKCDIDDAMEIQNKESVLKKHEAPKDVDRPGELSNSCLKVGGFYKFFFAFAFNSSYLTSVKTDGVRLEDVLKDYSRPRYEIQTYEFLAKQQIGKLLSNPKSHIFVIKDFDEGSRPEEQHLVVSCFDEEIVKFPTQPARTKISRDSGSNLKDFFIVLTREEVDIIGPIMVVDDESLMMFGSGPNIIKKDFSNDLDG
ncbi:hypothetical protein Tco_0484176 [Tanacetum coccineum]